MAMRAVKAGVAAALGAASLLVIASCSQDGARQIAAAPSTTVPGFGLFYVDEGGSAKLAYGQANSDDVDLMLECAKGSRTVQVTDVARTAGPAVLTLVSSGASARLNTRTDDGEGSTLLVADSAVDSAPLAAFRRTGRLEVSQAGVRHGLVARADERPGVERFFTACEGR
jgi:hypothetical protein